MDHKQLLFYLKAKVLFQIMELVNFFNCLFGHLNGQGQK